MTTSLGALEQLCGMDPLFGEWRCSIIKSTAVNGTENWNEGELCLLLICLFIAVNRAVLQVSLNGRAMALL